MQPFKHCENISLAYVLNCPGVNAPSFRVEAKRKTGLLMRTLEAVNRVVGVVVDVRYPPMEIRKLWL